MRTPFIVSLCLWASCIHAYNYLLDGACAAKLRMYNADPQYFQNIVGDAKTLALTAQASWPSAAPPIPAKGDTRQAAINKARDPLAADLFGTLRHDPADISRDQYTHVGAVFDSAAAIANAVPGPNPKFKLMCGPYVPEDGQKYCFQNPLMQTYKAGPNLQEAEYYIAVCPAFWDQFAMGRYWDYAGFTRHVGSMCSLKPLELGYLLGGRLIYHESIHFLKEEYSTYPKDWMEISDWGYGVDEGDGIEFGAKPRVPDIPFTSLTQATPDAYSFYGILNWRRSKCGWDKSGNFKVPMNFPLSTVPIDPGKDVGVFGDATRCPDGTKAAIDTVASTIDNKFLDVLWCPLQASAKATCEQSKWTTGTLTVLRWANGKGPGTQNLKGCFPSPMAMAELSTNTTHGDGLEQVVLEEL